MLSERSILSLCQYLALQERSFAALTLKKHSINSSGVEPGFDCNPDLLLALQNALTGASEEELHSLLGEIAYTSDDLRYRISPRYRDDERWRDLTGCLELDGYTVADGQFSTIDPTIAGTTPLNDDLIAELQRARIKQNQDIIKMLQQSADAFKREPPDYNACLTDARVALQTLATAIAKERQATLHGSFDETKWGQVIAYLRTSGMISLQEEEGLTGVFSFLSPGAHQPIGLTEREMARLGRALAVSMCYFLAKRYSGS